MIPIKLKINGFLSYQEPVEIDFRNFDLACISGANGSGKSSILDSITWSLFGQARRRDDAIINLQSEYADVEFIFEFQKNIYRIQRIKSRGKSSVLEFHIQTKSDVWNPLTERTLRATEAKIQEKLKLDYETFINASFFLQGKADQFTQQKPADRKRILGLILGLEIWEAYRAKAVEAKKESKNKLSSIEGRLEEITLELSEEDQRKEKLSTLQSHLDLAGKALEAQQSVVISMKQIILLRDTQLEKVTSLKKQIENATFQQDNLNKKNQARQEESLKYSSLIDDEINIINNHLKWEKTKLKLEELEIESDKFRDQESKRHLPLATIEKEKELLDAEKTRLLTLQIDNEKAFASIHQFEKEQKGLQKDIENIHLTIIHKSKLESDKEVALKNQLTAQAENPLLKEEMETLKERIEQLEISEGALCPICDQPLSAEERTLLINKLKKEGKEKGDKYRTNVSLVKNTTEITDGISKQIEQIKNIEESLREKTRQLDVTFVAMEKILSADANWKAEVAPRLSEIEQTLENKNFALASRNVLSKIDESLKLIGYDADNHDKMKAREKLERSAFDDKINFEKAQAALTPLAREIEDIEGQIVDSEKFLEDLSKKLNEVEGGVILEDSKVPNIREEEKKLGLMQEEDNRLRLQVGGAKQEVEVLVGLKKRNKKLLGEREGIGIEISKFTQLEKAFGKDGIPAMLIEQALPQIQENANKHLEKLGDGSMRIEFVTQLEYKDSKRKDRKETLDIHITDSLGKRDYELFSGGEGFRINFAIRLALAEVLAQRAGAQLQMLVIDEGFGSQDQLGRQRLVEVINLIKPSFKKILVITHIDSLKDVFPIRIEVSKITGRGSQIQIV
jgi:DNA repair protein SbcC/Rad50